MKKCAQRCVKIAIIVILIIGIQRFCHKQTRGFSISNISGNSRTQYTVSTTAHEQAEVSAALDQRFFFLNSGGQCYAFLSEDGKTVIKFFKHHHLRTWNWLHRMPLPQLLRHKLLHNKPHHSPFFFKSCITAYEELKERTGILYLHLTRSPYFNKKLTIVDRLGIAHTIDLDTTDFVLQKKAELPHQKLRMLIKQQNLDTAKQCLDSLLELMKEKQQKRIEDRDPNIRRNCGFIGTYAIEIDFGSFVKKEALLPSDANMKLTKSRRKFSNWLKKESEELSLYFEEIAKNADMQCETD